MRFNGSKYSSKHIAEEPSKYPSVTPHPLMFDPQSASYNTMMMGLQDFAKKQAQQQAFENYLGDLGNPTPSSLYYCTGLGNILGGLFGKL